MNDASDPALVRLRSHPGRSCLTQDWLRSRHLPLRCHGANSDAGTQRRRS